MHFFILGSSFVIATLIYKSINDCLSGKYHTKSEDELYIERLEKMPVFDYIQKINILQFFSEDENFERLKKVLDYDNKIFEKTKRLIDTNTDILEDYLNTQDFYGENDFHMESVIPNIIELRDTKFKTSFAQLNFIKWVILNDYFLHIE